MERVGEHPVPAGPLAVRWLARDAPPTRAGARHTYRLRLENAGLSPWQDVKLAYHWLDDRGNAIVWDGLRSDLPRLEPGESIAVDAPVRGPIPPGRYGLAFDLVLEHRYWFEELGNTPLRLDVSVGPRVERALAVRGAAPTNQEEPLVPESEAAAIAHLTPDCEPAPDWSRRILDAHQEGYAAVGGSVDGGRNRDLAPWKPGPGRKPAFDAPLLCPSVVTEIAASIAPGPAGLPALEPLGDEPWLYDGLITVRLRSGRRRG
jgi:hypothetical protein